MLKHLIISTSVLALTSVSTFAAGGPDSDSAALHAACKADFRKLCKNTPKVKGVSRLAACFKEHASEVSDGCKQTMAKLDSADQKERADKRALSAKRYEEAADRRQAAHGHKDTDAQPVPSTTPAPVPAPH